MSRRLVRRFSTAWGAPTSPIPQPYGLVVTPDGSKVLVADNVSAVQVIDTATNTLGAPIAVGASPRHLAMTPDQQSVYVTNYQSNSVSVIDLATLTIAQTIAVGQLPMGFNHFMGPNIRRHQRDGDAAPVSHVRLS